MTRESMYDLKRLIIVNEAIKVCRAQRSILFDYPARKKAFTMYKISYYQAIAAMHIREESEEQSVSTLFLLYIGYLDDLMIKIVKTEQYGVGYKVIANVKHATKVFFVFFYFTLYPIYCRELQEPYERHSVKSVLVPAFSVPVQQKLEQTKLLQEEIKLVSKILISQYLSF